jgi:hypothetical protein
LPEAGPPFADGHLPIPCRSADYPQAGFIQCSKVKTSAQTRYHFCWHIILWSEV